MTVVNVGLAAWIIQDGNYDDFQVDASYRFALEFHPQQIEASTAAVAGAGLLSHTTGAIHNAQGSIGVPPADHTAMFVTMPQGTADVNARIGSG